MTPLDYLVIFILVFSIASNAADGNVRRGLTFPQLPYCGDVLTIRTTNLTQGETR